MGDLERFRIAHSRDFAQAYAEIQNGYKETHWMWYIFPQIQGLGRSSIAQYYAISDIEEAVEFLSDPYLGDNLRAISKELLSKSTNDAEDIFSRFLSLVLRHKPEAAEIALDSNGWARVDELIVGVSKKYPIDMDVLELIVKKDDNVLYCVQQKKSLCEVIKLSLVLPCLIVFFTDIFSDI